jgi:hypothetical protein
MTVLHTESFIAFDTVVNDDAFTTDNSNMRLAVAAALRRAGYQVIVGAQSAAASGTGFATRIDPTAPDRVNLAYSSGVTVAAAGVIGGAIRKIIGPSADAIIGGFSLYIPAEFVKSTTALTTPILRMAASNVGDVDWQVYQVNTGTNAKEVFRISPDLAVRWALEAPMSGKTLQPGRLNYVEYRISDGEVRVWLDDVLVLQKAIALNSESIALIFENTVVTGGTIMAGLPGRWAIGNWYNLVEDARAPNVRLGPTTRVIGVRPDVDVSAQFTPAIPVGSNAAVVAQAIVDSPANSLQSTTVGDQDVYAVTTDSSTAGGAMVHAVAVKVLAANLESAPHALRPIIRTAEGVEGVDERNRSYRMLSSIIGSGRQLNGAARRPTDDRVFVVGAAYSLYSTPSNLSAPGGVDPVWTQHADDGSANNNFAIAFRADGMGVIARSDGKVGVLLPGSDVPTIITAAANTSILNGVTVLANGTFVAVGDGGTVLRSSTPDVPSSWVKSTAVAATYVLGSVATNGTRLVAGIATGLQNNVLTSDDSGATWAARVVGGTAATNNYKCVGWDGSAFVTAALNNGGYNRRSMDGMSWQAMNLTNNTNGTGQSSIGFVTGDPASGVMMMGGSSGVVVSMRNAFDMRAITTLTTTPAPATAPSWRGATTMGNGDWLFIGVAGQSALYTKLPTDIPLAPLAGYGMAFNSSSINPATGAAWTPTEASHAQFGMRLTS